MNNSLICILLYIYAKYGTLFYTLLTITVLCPNGNVHSQHEGRKYLATLCVYQFGTTLHFGFCDCMITFYFLHRPHTLTIYCIFYFYLRFGEVSVNFLSFERCFLYLKKKIYALVHSREGDGNSLHFSTNELRNV